MPLDAPFRLGPFIVNVHGRLEPGDPGQFPGFHVAWRGCPVHARLDATGGSAAAPANLILSAVVGRVSSTAGGDAARNRERRSATLGALQALARSAADTLQLRLLPDHRIAVDASRPVALPAAASDLLTQVTCFLLDLGPYLDLLGEADVAVESVGAAASSAAGTAKI
jgi:hypothetical protein